ncbi:MAG TPA: ABC transporter permease subunit [Pseudonocardia sp.]|jgi:putative spermidine/putrescine transport system permease protein|nr:ABC transporter permease subunit [Pseudonocardia sp.]
MALETETDQPSAAEQAPAPGRGGVAGWLRSASALLGVLPFAIYAGLFLAVPTVAIVVGAFQDPDSGSFTLGNLDTAFHGIYLRGFITSIELSVITSVVPGVLGLIIAYAVQSSRGTALKRAVSTASGVFANFGGVPLAFLFIATVGSSGLAVDWLKSLGFNPYDHGFSLYTFSGIALVYLYFQIPLMVLVITPALEGLRPAWREAADNLGATGWQYWRLVGGPVLLPAFLGSVLLLFGGAFSAYATTQALTSGSLAITPIQIGTFLNGNVLSGQENVGKALGFGMIVVIAAVMVVYAVLQRRASKWLQ